MTMSATLAPPCSAHLQNRGSWAWPHHENSALMRTHRCRLVVSWSHPRGNRRPLPPPNHLRNEKKRLQGAPSIKIWTRSHPLLDCLEKVRTLVFFSSSFFVPHLHYITLYYITLHYIILHYIITISSPEMRLQSVKQALHTAIPERLMSREAERASIRSFLEDKVLQHVPGSLYISGAPGTGKTACLNCVLQEMKVSVKESVVCHV